MEKISKILRSMIVVSGVVFLDQLTKSQALQKLSINQTDVIFSWFNLTLRKNKGVSFGLFPAYSFFEKMLLISLIVSLIVWIIYQLKNSKDRMEQIGYSLIIGGALGNLIDRICYGSVIDFLEFHLNKYYWPAFNLADSSIVLGAMLVFLKAVWQFSDNKKWI